MIEVCCINQCIVHKINHMGALSLLRTKCVPKKNPNKEWFVSQVDGHNLSHSQRLCGLWVGWSYEIKVWKDYCETLQNSLRQKATSLTWTFLWLWLNFIHLIISLIVYTTTWLRHMVWLQIHVWSNSKINRRNFPPTYLLNIHLPTYLIT